MPRRWLLITGIVAVALLGSVYAHTWGSGKTGPASPAAVGPVRAVLGESPKTRHDIGEVPQGGKREVSIVVSNPGPTDVTVGPIRVSCDCFRVDLDATRVEAGKEIGGRAVIDMAHEPKFVGWLMLDAQADEEGRPVFALKLSVRVR